MVNSAAASFFSLFHFFKMVILNLKQEERMEKIQTVQRRIDCVHLAHWWIPSAETQTLSLLNTHHLATWFPVSMSREFYVHLCAFVNVVCGLNIITPITSFLPTFVLLLIWHRSAGSQAFWEEITPSWGLAIPGTVRLGAKSWVGGSGREYLPVCVYLQLVSSGVTLYFETGSLLGPEAGQWACIFLSLPSQS